MAQNLKPALFGLQNCNRDITKKSSWGKNQFNSAFPAALACYMGHQQVKPVYLCLNENLEVTKQHISVQELFGLETLSPQLHFNFEAHYIPYEVLVTGNLPRVDLVTYRYVSREDDLFESFRNKINSFTR